MEEGKTKVIDVTCALIVNQKNQILVAQRSPHMNLPLKWEFPGGKIEDGETPEKCVSREIKEELNIEIEIIKSLPINVHSYSTITIKLIPFICKFIGGEITLKEHSDFRWFNPNELLDLNWADADIPILYHYLNI